MLVGCGRELQVNLYWPTLLMKPQAMGIRKQARQATKQVAGGLIAAILGFTIYKTDVSVSGMRA